MFKTRKISISVFLAAAFIGFADAAYLTFSHYSGSTLTCVVFRGCDSVTTSAYALFFGIPIALLGAGYYLLVLVGTIFALDTKNIRLLRIITQCTIVGFGISLYLLYLQLFVIHALCQYCILSLLTSTVLFTSSFFVRRHFHSSL